MLEETQLDMGAVHWVSQRKQFIVLTAVHPQAALQSVGRICEWNKRGVQLPKGNSWSGGGHRVTSLCLSSGSEG